MTKRERQQRLRRYVRQFARQAQAARALGLSPQHLNRIVKGHVRDVSPMVLARLEQATAADTTTAA